MALSDYIRPDLFRPRNLVPAAIVVAVVGGAWFALRPSQTDEPPRPQVVAPAPVEAPAPEPPPLEPVALPTVMVASRDLGAGVPISMDVMEWRQWHEPLDPSLGFITENVPLDSIVGTVTRDPLAAGELVTWEDLAMAGTSAVVTNLLMPGYRAMTVTADDATTRAQIIYPGDRVDVILVHSPGSGGVPSELGGGGGPASQIIVRDVRVLAVGSSTIDVHRRSVVSAVTEALLQQPEPASGGTYTLEVSALDAQRIALAVVVGHLTLVARPFSVVSAKDRSPYDESSRPVQFAEVIQGLAPYEEELQPLPPLPIIRIIRGRGGIREQTVNAPENAASREAAELPTEALRGG